MAIVRYMGLFLASFFLLFSSLHASGDFKYSYMPKQVYENQLFPVTVICQASCTKNSPRFSFDERGGVAPISNIPVTIQNGNDSFYTFYFKAGKSDMRIPALNINLDANKSAYLEAHTISLGTLDKREDFCNVLAADMKINNSQVSNYDEHNHLVTLTVSAVEANLEDMTMPNVIEYGIENLKRDASKVNAEFYFVLPVNRTNIKFTYFNTIKKQYMSLELPIELQQSTVTTQTDLNPKEDSFDLLKKYTLMSLVGFFFLMFLFKRDFFYLVLGAVSLITLLTLYIPHKKVCINQGAPLYILPTSTSTISLKVEDRTETMLLGEHNDYIKIEYKKGIIGWIKDEDICKN